MPKIVVSRDQLLPAFIEIASQQPERMKQGEEILRNFEREEGYYSTLQVSFL
jgi:hypothetical protein